jgi:hypothetical protein
MARKEIAPILAKDFVVCKIDQDRMVGGKDLYARYCAKPGGIPWFCILDGKGKTLATSDGPKGNIGCPYSDEEIEVFLEILKKVRVRLEDEDLAALKKSLVAQQEKKR